MSDNSPSPTQLLEDLAGKVAIQIDRNAPAAFEIALDEMVRYHRFLLKLYASQTPDNIAASYAAISGEDWIEPHRNWIKQYRGLFERAANRIGEAPDFISRLAYVARQLLPQSDEPPYPDEINRSILSLGPILVHQMEAWVTRRAVTISTGIGTKTRKDLLVSDATAYADILPEIVAAWDRVQQILPSSHRWKESSVNSETEQWHNLTKHWPHLWEHLIDTAYILAEAVWNNDEAGAAIFGDTLIRWAQVLDYAVGDPVHFSNRRLIFPDLMKIEWQDVTDEVKPLLPAYLQNLGPAELFGVIVREAHKDVLAVVSSLFLFWSMSTKQKSDIGARIAKKILHRELQDREDHRAPEEISFGSLLKNALRMELAGSRYGAPTYGGQIERLVRQLDDMTERRVIPGRVYTPSTLHGKDELLLAEIAIMLSTVPSGDNSTLVSQITELLSNIPRVQKGEASRRDILSYLGRISEALKNSSPLLEKGVGLLNSGLDFDVVHRALTETITNIIETIKSDRDKRLRQEPIAIEILAQLGKVAEDHLLTLSGPAPFFQGYTTEKIIWEKAEAPVKRRHSGRSKGEFVNPPTEADTGFSNFYSNDVVNSAKGKIWRDFSKRPRQKIKLQATTSEKAFWDELVKLSGDVGAQPSLLVPAGNDALLIRRFLRPPTEGVWHPRVEKKKEEEVERDYIATVEGIDVFLINLPQGTAWLYSPFLLQKLGYMMMNGEKIVVPEYVPENDLKGTLVTEFLQKTIWADWPIYEIKFRPSKPSKVKLKRAPSKPSLKKKSKAVVATRRKS